MPNNRSVITLRCVKPAAWDSFAVIAVDPNGKILDQAVVYGTSSDGDAITKLRLHVPYCPADAAFLVRLIVEYEGKDVGLESIGSNPDYCEDY